MKVWNQCVLGSAIGKTAGTYDEIGKITLRSGARYILGFYINVVDAKPTDGENGVGIVRITSTDLGVAPFTVVGNQIVPDGDAATTTQAVTKKFHAWSVEVPEGTETPEITFELTTNVAKTEGYEAGIQLVTADQPPDEEFKMELKGSIPSDYEGGDHAEEDAGVSTEAYASWGTAADLDVIKVSSRAKELRNVLAEINLNAFAADDPGLAVFKFESPDIPDFAPQEFLSGAGFNSPLGTVIDVGQAIEANYFPTRFPLPGKSFKVEIFDKVSNTLGNAADGVAAWQWRH